MIGSNSAMSLSGYSAWYHLRSKIRLRAMSRLLRTRERLVSGFRKFSKVAVPEAIRRRIEALNSSPADQMRRHSLSIVEQFAIFRISWNLVSKLWHPGKCRLKNAHPLVRSQGVR